MDEGIDSGDILSQSKIKIDYKDDARSLYNKVISMALEQIDEFIPVLRNNALNTIKQDNSKANYWRKRGEKDGQIDWRMSAEAIYNLVRALTKPYIGAHFIYKTQNVKIWKVKEVKSNSYKNFEPGKVIKTYFDASFLIKTGQDCIKVLECDLKQKIKAGEYI